MSQGFRGAWDAPDEPESHAGLSVETGRVARVLAMLMGLQAGLPPLDFSPLEGRGKERYFLGIRAAMGRDYAPLVDTFSQVIDRTWKRASSNGP